MILKMRSKSAGTHTHIDIFSGKNKDHLANNGRLTFLKEEWRVFADRIQGGILGPIIRGFGVTIDRTGE